MNLGNITQKGFELTSDITVLPYQHSENPQITFIKDVLYKDYVAVANISYFNGRMISTVSTSIVDGVFKLLATVLKNDGEIAIAISLSNGDETINTGCVAFSVREAPGITTILPDQVETWQNIVIAFLNEYIKINVTDQLEALIKANKELNNTAAELEFSIDQAINNCGQYVFENDVLRFKQADGTFGQDIIIPGSSGWKMLLDNKIRLDGEIVDLKVVKDELGRMILSFGEENQFIDPSKIKFKLTGSYSDDFIANLDQTKVHTTDGVKWIYATDLHTQYWI